jgi:hypothetical protein
MVQSFERYIDAYGPRVYGHSPGCSPSAGPYTGSTGTPEWVSKSASRLSTASYAARHRSFRVLTGTRLPAPWYGHSADDTGELT